MEPLGFIAGALVGAAICGATLSGQRRQPELAGRVLTLERRLDQHAAEFTELKTDLGRELREQDGRITEHGDELEALNIAVGRTLASFEEQLQGMQTFIVQAAQDARERRVALSTAPPLQDLVGGGGEELNALMRQQREAQQEFAARRRADAAAGFQQPAGGGL